jgi:hypothetical protein
MRTVLFSTAMLAGIVCLSSAPAKATPQPTSGIAAAQAQVAPVEDVGYRRRKYRRYGYPVPYAYYPPVYGYYPPPAYAYSAPVYPTYPYYAPYRYYRPYYSPYY